MKQLIFALSISFLLSLTALAQKPCKAYAPAGAIFTICPPDSVQSVQAPGQQFISLKKTADDPSVLFFMTMVETEASPATLMEMGYGFISNTYADKEWVNTVLKEVGDFTTTSGSQGLRLVFEMNKPQKDRIRQIHYIFMNAKLKPAIFTAILLPNAPADAALADSVIKTVKIK